MDFRLSEDQVHLRESVSDFLEKESPIELVKECMTNEDGGAPELYRKMADLGWLSLAVPEESGGVGLGLVEQAVVMEQMGYFNAPGPFFTTSALGIPALLTYGKTELLQQALSGEKSVAVADDQSFVVDGQLADFFILTQDGDAFLIERGKATVTAHGPTDGTRRTATVEFDEKNAERLGDAADLNSVFRNASALLAAECAGGIQRVLDVTLDYSKVRTQFGRLIGSYQVVKHRLADMLIKLEATRAAAYYAAWSCQQNAPDAELSASVAKSYASDAFKIVSGEGVQLHGGIGFTWEHEAHIYFKRAQLNSVFLGSDAEHRLKALSLATASLA